MVHKTTREQNRVFYKTKNAIVIFVTQALALLFAGPPCQRACISQASHKISKKKRASQTVSRKRNEGAHKLRLLVLQGVVHEQRLVMKNWESRSEKGVIRYVVIRKHISHTTATTRYLVCAHHITAVS